MTIQLIHAINQIIKFGIEPNLIINKNERDLLLEKSLINIYSLILTTRMTMRTTKNITNTNMQT